jgi:hypothetical protein
LEGRGCPRQSFVLEEHFRGPPTFQGIPGPKGPLTLGHLDVWAVPDGARAGQDGVYGCPSSSVAGGVSVGGVSGLWYRCREGSSGLDSGHVLLVWKRGDITYGVGSHGHTATSRRLVLAIVRQLTYVSGASGNEDAGGVS